MRWIQNVNFFLIGFFSLVSFCEGSDDFDLELLETPQELNIRNLRELQIEKLQSFLDHQKEKKEIFSINLRLIDLYLESYESIRSLEERVKQKNSISQKKSLKEISYSKKWLDEIYKKLCNLLSLKVSDPRMDRVYYLLGYVYKERDQFSLGKKYFEFLIENFKNSQYIAFAAKELGYYFYLERKDLEALHYFSIALKKVSENESPDILYWMSHCHHRQNDDFIALEKIKKSIEISKKYSILKDEYWLTFIQFSLQEDPLLLIKDLKDLEKDPLKLLNLFLMLDLQYQKILFLEGQKKVLQEVLNLAPEEKIILIKLRLSQVVFFQKDYRSLLREVDYFYEKSLKISSFSSEAQEEFFKLKKLVKKQAFVEHRFYRDQKKELSLVSSEILYDIYIKILSLEDSVEDLHEIEMLLAEIKFNLKKTKEAFLMYQKILHSKDPKWAKQAGTQAMSVITYLLKKEVPSDSSPSPTQEELQLIEIIDAMQELSLESSQKWDLRLKAAQVLAGYPKTQSEARERIQKMVQEAPQTTQALVATELLFQFDEPSASQLLKTYPILSRHDQVQYQGRLTQGMYESEQKEELTRIQQLEKEEKFLEVAKAYQNLSEKSKDPFFQEVALRKAMQFLLKVEATQDLIKPFILTWKKRFGKSSRLKEMLRTSATQAWIQSQWELAAELFYELGQVASEEASLWLSAQFFEALHQEHQQQEVLDELLSQYPNSKKRWQVIEALGRSQERAGLFQQAADSYQKCAHPDSPLQMQCWSRHAHLYWNHQDWMKAQALFQKILQSGKNDPEVRNTFAYVDAEFFVNNQSAEVRSLKEKNKLFFLLLPRAQSWLGIYWSSDNGKVTQDQTFASLAQGFRHPFQRSSLELKKISDIQKILLENPQNELAWRQYAHHLADQKKFALARLMIQKALSLNSHSVASLNDLAVFHLMEEDLLEDAYVVTQVAQILSHALKLDEFNLNLIWNIGCLLSYYRLFDLSTLYWEKIVAQDPSGPAWLALAIVSQGKGQTEKAQGFFKKAMAFDLSPWEGNVAYFKALQGLMHATQKPSHPMLQSVHGVIQNKEKWNQCQKLLNLSEDDQGLGFEKIAFQNLKEKCHEQLSVGGG